jgi:hypothetical protein
MVQINMSYLSRIVRIENGKPIFSNEISDAKAVGEILLKKTPDDNICNICLKLSKLTGDHVPPQCMGNNLLTHYINYAHYLSKKDVQYKGISQDGIKYETICSSCNNEKLKFYDDELNNLYSSFRNVEISNRLSIRLRIKPNKIIRGILGHFLSAKTSHERTDYEDIFADTIDSPNKPINPELGFYVAPYLSEQIRIIRDLLINEAKVSINAIKIKPLAFIVTFPKVSFGFADWSLYFDSNVNDEYEVNLFGTRECELEYPERYFHPTLFGRNGAESIIGFPQT